MNLTERLTVAVAPARVRPMVADLEAYPDWFDLIARVADAPAVDDDPGPAWRVDLRGRVGPLARSKRLRMVRVVDEPRRIVFERREASRRQASPWRLDVELAGDGATELTVRLEYGGRWWGPVIERVLRDAIERAKPRLRALAEAP